MIVALYIAAVLVALFVMSGVLPRYRESADRLKRVIDFERYYREWAELDAHTASDWDLVGRVVSEEEPAAAVRAAELRPWLVARRNTMQRDAQSVGKGIMYVAPPLMIGGSFKPHPYFSDLFDEQTDSVGSRRVRLDDLVTIIHEVGLVKVARRRALFSPGAWVQLTFARLVRVPAGALLLAGFSDEAAATTLVKLMGAVWSFLVGAATIAGLVWVVTHPTT